MRGIELSYAVRRTVVAKYSAQLGLVLAGLTLPPLVVAVANGEYPVAACIGAVLAVLVLTGAMVGGGPAPARIQANEALVIASLAFVLAPLFMTLPLAMTGLPLVDALFEAVSAVTTTGLSTLGSVEGRSTTFFFTRAWMQWYGGLGIVVLSFALFHHPGSVARNLYGDVDRTDLVGSTTAHARSVLMVYVILTIAGTSLLVGAGLDPWRAWLHTLSAVSTGGFSTSGESLAGIGGSAVWFAVMAICFCGAAAGPLQYSTRPRLSRA
jgi:trk system potassium uptake protein TrkH